jgi:hypothetical protein
MKDDGFAVPGSSTAAPCTGNGTGKKTKRRNERRKGLTETPIQPIIKSVGREATLVCVPEPAEKPAGFWAE